MSSVLLWVAWLVDTSPCLTMGKILANDPAVRQHDVAAPGEPGNRVDPAVIDAMLAGDIAAVIGDADDVAPGEIDLARP